MIKTIIFDIGGVIFSDGSQLAYEKVGKLLCVDKPILKSLIGETTDNGAKYRKGLISPEQMWTYVLDSTNPDRDLTWQELNNLWKQCYVPNEEVIGFIKSISSDFKLAILSNMVKDRYEYMCKFFDFDKYFEHIELSYQTHLLKPHKEAFESIISNMQIIPEETMFIDDKQANVDMAMEVGLVGVLFDGVSKLEKMLD